MLKKLENVFAIHEVTVITPISRGQPLGNLGKSNYRVTYALDEIVCIYVVGIIKLPNQ